MAIAYLSEDEDAEHSKSLVEQEGRKAITIKVDLQTEDACREAVTRTVDNFVAKLRHKLDADRTGATSIATVHGVGYRFSL